MSYCSEDDSETDWAMTDDETSSYCDSTSAQSVASSSSESNYSDDDDTVWGSQESLSDNELYESASSLGAMSMSDSSDSSHIQFESEESAGGSVYETSDAEDDEIAEDSPLTANTVNCPICFGSVLDNQPVSTFCGHLFCKACIEASLAMTNKHCPICRKNLNGQNPFHVIHPN